MTAAKDGPKAAQGGFLFNIQRASLDDGPGVRTTLFFKGCPLWCPWCHNPESQNMRPELMALDEKCRKCGICGSVCKYGAIENACVNRALCAACGDCEKACPHGALKMAGKHYTVEEAVREALLDRAFFETSGGGVTLSGGEPLAQPGFALEILKELKLENIHTCVETCGICADSVIESLLPYVDHWLFDIKLTDEAAHQALLGAPLSDVLKRLYALKGAGAGITLRCPVIPGINDTDEHLSAIRKLARDIGAIAVDILPYHRLGRDKYAQLGRATPRDIPAPDGDAVKSWESKFHDL